MSASCRAPQRKVCDVAAYHHLCPVPGAAGEFSCPGTSFHPAAQGGPAKHGLSALPQSAEGMGSIHKGERGGVEGDAGFACPDRGGGRGEEAVRVSKALVGPAGVLAPVNQAVIE